MPEFSNDIFEKNLKRLDMLKASDENTGLVFVGDKRENFYEIIALEQAEKYEADAVYFRYFDNGRPPMPQIYIYDYTLNEKSDEEIAKLHKRLWNAAKVPLFFVFLKTEVKIFNCLKQPEFDDKTGKVLLTLFEKIEIASNVKKEIKKIRNFSGKKFDNGTFWNDPKYKNEFKADESIYITLLKQLRETRKNIIAKKILSKKTTEKLLVMSILVKYLEERKDENGDTVFPKGFFSKFTGKKEKDSFLDILKTKGASIALFDELSSKERFNGDIFSWKDEKERNELEKADLKAFADEFFEGKVKKRQYTFWRLYSFNDLPIELISNIYEEFLESKEDGIVYTPPYLVNFLIDETIPISDFEKTDFKVLDPACGSGIFLVAAYRRMIQWWRIRNNWKKPGAEDLEELKDLLKNNIYGADKHEEAVRLAFFSLSLVLMDELSPKVIWENLKFDNLFGINFISEDFFKLINNNFFKMKFDLVIGNPPFISKLTPEARKIEAIKSKERPKLPDNQIALLFLEQGMNLCKKNALLCLIMPAGPFLYNDGSYEFRKYFLETFHVLQIIDFTPLSAILFESAKVAVAAAFVKNRNSDKKGLLHVTVRRTKPVKEKMYFELDYYDFHKVSYNDALRNRLIWKSNLLGGGRLKHLIMRFAPMRKLGEYLNEKRENNGWKIAEGYIIGNKKEINELIELKRKSIDLSKLEKNRLEKLEKKYKKADYLTGKQTLYSNREAFSEKGINNFYIGRLEEKYFIRNREKNKEIFKAPHILIKENAGKNSIPVIFLDYDITFRNEIGIYAPKNQEKELKEIERRMKDNKIYLFFLAGLSGRYMISRASSVLEGDILSLPYPEDERDLNLSEIERILVDDCLDYILDFHRKGENSKAEKFVTKKELKKFSEIYCRLLNSVYKKFEPLDYIETDSFICQPFYHKNKPEITDCKNKEEIETYLYELIQNNYTGSNSRIIRIMRIYEKNVIYLIKPKEARYWLKSVAVRDADETFSDMISMGY